MKKLLLLLFLSSSIDAISQIKIELGDMPLAGDTPRYSIAEPSPSFLLSYKNTGANYTWNFDSLKSLEQDVEKYLSSSQTNYNFPGTIAKLYADTFELGAVMFTDIYDFFDTSSSSFTMIGRGLTYGFPISIPFTKKDSIYQFPLEYLDRDSSIFEAKFVQAFLGVYYLSNGYRINEVDGYGQITTPFGTFDVIRVVTDIVQSDTISYDTTQARINTHRRDYKWLAKGMEYPILQVSGTVTSGNFFPLSISYKDSIHPSNPVGIHEKAIPSNAISIQPNPILDNQLRIVIELENSQFNKAELLDISGKEVFSKNFQAVTSKKTFSFDLDPGLPNGIYFLRISGKHNAISKKVVLNR